MQTPEVTAYMQSLAVHSCQDRAPTYDRASSCASTCRRALASLSTNTTCTKSCQVSCWPERRFNKERPSKVCTWSPFGNPGRFEKLGTRFIAQRRIPALAASPRHSQTTAHQTMIHFQSTIFQRNQLSVKDFRGH